MPVVRVVLYSASVIAFLNLVTILSIRIINLAAIGLNLIVSFLLIVIGVVYLIDNFIFDKSKRSRELFIVMTLSGSINLIFWMKWLREIGAAF